jgi:hypothetical protein
VGSKIVEAIGRASLPGRVRSLADLLGRLPDCLGPEEVRKLGALARRLGAGAASCPDAEFRTRAETLLSLAPYLDPAERRQRVDALADRSEKILRGPHPFTYSDLGTVVELAGRLDPARARRLARAAVARSRTARPNTGETSLSSALYSLAKFLEPGELRQLAEEAARGPGGPAVAHYLASYLGKEKEAAAEDAARVAEGLETRSSARDLRNLAQTLARAAPLLEPAAARKLADRAARRLATALRQSSDPGEWFLLADGLGALAGLLGAAGVEEAAGSLVDVLFPPREFPTRPRLLGVLGGLAGRLSPQQQVDLLKRPTCRGPARDAVLRVVGERLQRNAGNVPDLVEWLDKNRPEIDLKSPPRRPRD